MIYYKNVSLKSKQFHGVTFAPGQVAGVDKFINDPFMIVVNEPIKKKVSKDQPHKAEPESDGKSIKEVKPDGEDRNQ